MQAQTNTTREHVVLFHLPKDFEETRLILIWNPYPRIVHFSNKEFWKRVIVKTEINRSLIGKFKSVLEQIYENLQ